MPMSEDNRNAHTREEIAHRIFDRLTTMAAREWPGLSDGQRRGLVEHIFSVVGEWGDQVPDSEYKDQFFLAERNAELKEFFRPTPTPREVEAALAKSRGITSPADRITLAREVADMKTADARLNATRGLEIPAVTTTTPAAKQSDAEITSEERARGIYEPADRELERRGVDLKTVLPLKRQELRALVAKEMAPKTTPAIKEAQAKLAAGRTWGQLSPVDRANCQREAEAAKKTLRDFGLGGGV